MKTKSIFAVCAALFWMVLPAVSQNNKGISINSNPGSGASGKVYALIVGISKYQNVPGLNYADADAYNFYKYLVSPAGGNVDTNNIKLLLNEHATSANIFGSLDWLLENAKEGETVMIYFSGHGDLETKTMAGSGFLLASDAPKSCYMAGGTIGLFYLQNYLNTLVSRNKARVIMISDACKSGKLAGGAEGVLNTTEALQAQWSNVIKILSSQTGELSQEGQKWGNGAGVFSFFLLNGLKGLADMNNDKKVTLLETFIYLSENVARETSNTQNPAIVGNQSTVLAFVDSATLAAVQQTLGNQQAGGQLAMKGFSDDIIKLLNPEVAGLYQRFQACITRGYLLKGNDSLGNAWDLYKSLEGMEEAGSIMSSVKRMLLAALQNKSQIAINNWVKGEGIPDTISTYTAYRELSYAMDLIDSTYIMYDYIRARYLFWKSVYTDDLREKLDIMTECVRIEPDAPFAYHQLGAIYSDLKDYQNSILNLRKAHQLAPGWTYPINDIGVAYDNLGQPDSAIYYYRKAITIDPQYPLSHNNLAIIYTQQTRYDTAMYYADKAIGLNPERGSYYITKGIIFRRLGMFDQSIQLIEEGIAMEPDEPGHYYHLGVTYQEKKDYPRAVTSFKKAIAYDNSVEKYHKELARTYIYMDKNERGLEIIKEAIHLNPEDDENYSISGMAYHYMGKYAEAEACYKKAVDMDSASAYNWRYLSRAYRYNKSYDNAIRAAHKSVELDSTAGWNMYYLSQAYMYAGKYPEAENWAKRSLELDPKNPDFEVNLASLYNKMDDFDQSLLHYKNAITLDPDEPAYYKNVGWAYARNKQYEQAETYFLLCIKHDSTNIVRYIELANFYRNDMKDYVKSEIYFHKASALDPSNYLIQEGMGYLYMRTGNVKKAEAAFLKSIELAPNVAWNYYNLACLYSVNGKNKKAFEWLEASLQKGMNDLEHIKSDTDMDPIRQTPEFKALMKRYLGADL